MSNLKRKAKEEINKFYILKIKKYNFILFIHFFLHVINDVWRIKIKCFIVEPPILLIKIEILILIKYRGNV